MIEDCKALAILVQTNCPFLRLSVAEALLVDHPRLHVDWRYRSSLGNRLALLDHSPRHRLCHRHSLLLCKLLAPKHLELFEDVLTIIPRLPHALIEVIQRGVRHLKCLRRDSCNTTQVSLIALILENSFLSQLNLVLLLKLSDERLEELLLGLHFLHLGLDLHCDALLHPSLVHFIAMNLDKKLQVAKCAEHERAVLEALNELGFTCLLLLLLLNISPMPEKLLDFVQIAPLFDGTLNNFVIAITLPENSLSYEQRKSKFCENIVHRLEKIADYCKILYGQFFYDFATAHFIYLPVPPSHALSSSYLCKSDAACLVHYLHRL